MPGPYMLEQSDLEGVSGVETTDLSEALLQAGEPIEVRETGPYPCIHVLRHAVSMQCFRALDIPGRRYLSPEEIEEAAAQVNCPDEKVAQCVAKVLGRE